MVGLAMVVTLVLFAVVAPLFVGDPNASDLSLLRGPSGGPPGPSSAHWLGTAPLFRDLLARLAHGARLSLTVALGAIAIATVLGTTIGLVSGYASASRRWLWLDMVLMRLVDAALAFPYLLLITAIGVALDRSDATAVILILGLTSWTGLSRVVRAKTSVVARADFVTAARALGASPLHIVYRHLLPSAVPILLVIGSQAVAQMILAEAVLGYLTVGVEPPAASWGRMVHESQHYIGSEPLLVAAPALAVILAVLGFTRVGDGLREAVDPKRRALPSSRIPVDLVLVVAVLLLLPFAEPEPLAAPLPIRGATTIQRGGVLRLATSVEVRTLDPALAYDGPSRVVGDLLFAKLVTWDANGELTGELAERWVVSSNATRVTFWLKKGLRFHDGAALEAADVKRSLERTLHPKTPCPGASLYSVIRGVSAFRSGKAPQIDGLVVDGNHRLHVDLVEPSSTFLPLMSLGFAAPVCPSSGPIAQGSAPTPPCGAGPFRLKQMVRGERIALERFEQFHEPEKPYLDGVTWLLGVAPHTQRYRFERGEIDILNEQTGVDAARYDADPAWEPQRHWATQPATFGVFLNTEVAPFDNRHVRRAVSLALDPSELSKVRATVAPTDRIIPPGVPGPARDTPMRKHDLAAALREMERAGYAYDPQTGAGGYPGVVDYTTIPDSFAQSTAEIAQQQLARIGIRVRLRLVSFASFLVDVGIRGKVPMGWKGWQADYPDPSTFFETTLTSGAITDRGSQNTSFFSNAELDELIKRARSERDRPARMALFARAEALVRDEAPWIPLYITRKLELWQPYVRGYRPNPVLELRVRDVWLDRAEGGP